MQGVQSIVIPSESSSERHQHQSRLIVVLGFLGSFIFAYLIFSFIASFWAPRGSSSLVAHEDTDGDDVFTEALVVKGPANAARISDAPGLNPQATSDFVFFIWFKLREPLSKEERVYIMGKYDPTSKDRVGYGIALASGPDGVRPQVYWQAATGRGKWYTFAATPLKPQQWYLLAFSFREHKYLGVHLTPLGSDAKPKLLGGYTVDSPDLPTSNSDLIVGAFGSSFFKGRVGPFGILQTDAFSKDIGELLTTLAREPLTLPSSIEANEVALWASPRKDRGPQALKIFNARSGKELASKQSGQDS